MGLIEKIEKIQRRPESERHKIFIVTLTLSMVIVIGIWFTTLKYNVGSWGRAEKESAPSPLGLIRESVDGAVGDIKKAVTAGIKNVNYQFLIPNAQSNPNDKIPELEISN